MFQDGGEEDKDPRALFSSMGELWGTSCTRPHHRVGDEFIENNPDSTFTAYRLYIHGKSAATSSKP